MTTYTTIANGDIDQDSRVTQPLMTALRDNPIATAEGVVDAPVVAAAWHPFDAAISGDGADGLIYDNAVDGNVASIETGTLDAGWDYKFIIDELSHNSGSNRGIRVGAYKSVDASYARTFITLAVNSSTSLNLEASVLLAANPLGTKYLTVVSAGIDAENQNTGIDTNNQETTNLQLDLDGSGNFDAGRVFLFRRRNYTT